MGCAAGRAAEGSGEAARLGTGASSGCPSQASLPPSVAEPEVRGSRCSLGLRGSALSTAPARSTGITLFRGPGAALEMRGPAMLGVEPQPQQHPGAAAAG